MRLLRAVVLAAVSFPPALQAQASDSLHIGDRVRVTVAATRGNTNVFMGSIDRLSPDTMVIAIPGGKGSVILPRLAIAEVSISDGRESRLANVPRVLPLLMPAALFATLPTPKTGHWVPLRNERYMLIGLSLSAVTSRLARTPAERWTPVYNWLERR
jgi:hypothetical protein